MHQTSFIFVLILSMLSCTAAQHITSPTSRLTPEEKCIYATIKSLNCNHCNKETCLHCDAIKKLQELYVPSSERMHSKSGPTVLEFNAYLWALSEPFSFNNKFRYCNAYIAWYDEFFSE